jgi:hypothetical protein
MAEYAFSWCGPASREGAPRRSSADVKSELHRRGYGSRTRRGLPLSPLPCRAVAIPPRRRRTIQRIRPVLASCTSCISTSSTSATDPAARAGHCTVLGPYSLSDFNSDTVGVSLGLMDRSATPSLMLLPLQTALALP